MKLKACIYYTLVILAVAVVSQPSEATAACSDKRMVVLGDSLSAGYGLPPGKGFPEQLAEALSQKGFDLEVQNAGVSGDTTSGGLARLDWSVGDGVDLVVLELGANDALRGIPVEITRSNLDTMIERLKKRGIDVLLAGMLAPPNMGEVYADAFKTVYSDLSVKHGIPLYPFFLEGVAADPDLNLDDAIHPNEEGVKVIVRNIMPMVIDQLEQVCSS